MNENDKQIRLSFNYGFLQINDRYVRLDQVRDFSFIIDAQPEIEFIFLSGSQIRITIESVDEVRDFINTVLSYGCKKYLVFHTET